MKFKEAVQKGYGWNVAIDTGEESKMLQYVYHGTVIEDYFGILSDSVQNKLAGLSDEEFTAFIELKLYKGVARGRRVPW